MDWIGCAWRKADIGACLQASRIPINSMWRFVNGPASIGWHRVARFFFGF